MTVEEADNVMRKAPLYVERTVLTRMQVSPGGDLRDLYRPGMTVDEADNVMRKDPRYVARTVLTHMQVSPGGDLRDLYRPGMTVDEADDVIKATAVRSARPAVAKAVRADPLFEQCLPMGSLHQATTTARTPPDYVATLPIGAEVEARDLKTATELNGKVGTVLNTWGEPPRAYGVRFYDPGARVRDVRVKVANLKYRGMIWANSLEEVLPFGATRTSPAGFYDEEEIQLRAFNSAMNMSEMATDKERFVRLAKEDAANRAIEENLEKCRCAAAQQGRQMGRS